MKVGIWDGCANGGMMDSLSIHYFEEGKGKPSWIADVSYDEWTAWKAFLKEHDKWDLFWDKQMSKENRNR